MRPIQARDITSQEDIDEAGSLAVERADAYRRMAAFYRDHLELSGPEADQRARGLGMPPEEANADAARIRDRPPDQVSGSTSIA